MHQWHVPITVSSHRRGGEGRTLTAELLRLCNAKKRAIPCQGFQMIKFPGAKPLRSASAFPPSIKLIIMTGMGSFHKLRKSYTVMILFQWGWLFLAACVSCRICVGRVRYPRNLASKTSGCFRSKAGMILAFVSVLLTLNNLSHVICTRVQNGFPVLTDFSMREHT